MKTLKTAYCSVLGMIALAAVANAASASSCDVAIRDANRRLDDIESVLARSRNASQLWNSRGTIQAAVGDVKAILLDASGTSGNGTKIFEGFDEDAYSAALENAITECINQGYYNCRQFGGSERIDIVRNGRTVSVVRAKAIGNQ